MSAPLSHIDLLWGDSYLALNSHTQNIGLLLKELLIFTEAVWLRFKYLTNCSLIITTPADLHTVVRVVV